MSLRDIMEWLATFWDKIEMNVTNLKILFSAIFPSVFLKCHVKFSQYEFALSHFRFVPLFEIFGKLKKNIKAEKKHYNFYIQTLYLKYPCFKFAQRK